MGTRTDILKIAGNLKEFAAKNPSVARGLQPIVAELEACAERADRKRMTKKKAVEELVAALPRAPMLPAGAPKASFLSSVVGPRITDVALKRQIADYEKALAAYLQQVERSNQACTAALGVFKSRWDA
ncbi:MAG: hypothetical protein U1F41_10545 [Burkholderiales bacterium]